MAREADKYDRCAAFGHALPLLRARLADELARRTLCAERVVAAVVRLPGLAALRIGNEENVTANTRFGANTTSPTPQNISGPTLTLAVDRNSGTKRDRATTET